MPYYNWTNFTMGNMTNPELAKWAFLIPIFMAFAFLFFLLFVGLYIYTSLTMMAIAKKTKYPEPGIAWIPVVGPLLITSRAAKMPWWPILLLIGAPIPFVGFLFSITVGVFSVIWMWKTFEAIKKPGYWAVLSLIPPLSLIFLGIAAWSKNKSR